VDLKVILIIIAFVFALPIGIVLSALIAPARVRWLSLLGAAVAAALTAGGVYLYASTIQVDGLSYGLGAFLAIAAGAIIGSLVVNFLASLGDRRPGGLPLEL
jgi:hypothetical protein